MCFRLNDSRWGCLVLLLLSEVVWSCGVQWRNRLLIDAEEELLVPPEASFWEESQKILNSLNIPEDILHPPGPEGYETEGFVVSYVDKTFYVEYAQIREALYQEIPHDEAEKVLDEYWKIRRALCAYVEHTSDTIPDGSRESIESFTIPETIPAEHAIYLRGAIAYHLGDFRKARREWLRLFELPQYQRPHTTARGAYMLAKLCIESTPEEAIAWFDKARRHILESGRDDLGLFVASCGLEAPIHYAAGRYARALYYYAIYEAAGGEFAYASMQFAVRHLIAEGNPDELRWAAGNPVTQRLVTAYIVSRPYQLSRYVEGLFQLSHKNNLRDRVLMWLDILEDLGASHIDGADRLALAAYQAGKTVLADRWLSLASADSLVAKWVRSKLLLREGKVTEAEALLAEIARADRRERIWREWNKNILFWNRFVDGLEDCDRVWGELAVLYLDRGKWTESLDAFLRGEYWLDAAYVAERVLTTEELRSYVDEILSDEISGNLRRRIRYLLARRLAREDRGIGPTDYYPPGVRGLFEKYRKNLRISKNPHNTSRRRAQALEEAARLTRFYGMELFGTEIEPDWTYTDGEYELQPTSLIRVGMLNPDRSWQPNPSAIYVGPEEFFNLFRREEERRVRRHVPFPNRRFHYRYRAAALAWQAAELLPDDDEETARVLWEAGSWLKVRDPEFADHFYKSLVNRNPHVPLAREADRLRWFPRADEEGNPILPNTARISEDATGEIDVDYLGITESEEGPGLGKPMAGESVPESTNRARKDWKALKWYSDLASATRAALARHKPILIDFSTEWCVWCRKLEEETYSNPMIWNALNDLFVLVKLDGDEDRELARRFQVTAYPSLYMADSTGTVLVKWDGFLDPLEFDQRFVSAAALIPKMEAYEKAYRQGEPEKRKRVEKQLRESLPDDSLFLNNLAWNLTVESRNLIGASLILAEKAVEMDPEVPEFLETLARIELTVGHYDRAVEHYRTLAEKFGGIRHLWLAVSLAVRSGSGDADQAIQTLKRYFETEILAKTAEKEATVGR